MFLFTFNVATRTFKIIYEAYLTLLLDNTVQDYQAVPSEDRHSLDSEGGATWRQARNPRIYTVVGE